MVAVEEHDVALKMLIAERPRKPKADERLGITVGGEQEAWLYRVSARALWEGNGGLDWLKRTSPKARR